MPKLIVSAELGAGLQNLFKQYPITKNSNIDWILETHYKVKHGVASKWSGGNWVHLNKLKMHELAQAIYEGYEVEPTPLEKLETFEEANTNLNECISSYVHGVETTIKFFKENFVIKGVNDNA